MAQSIPPEHPADCTDKECKDKRYHEQMQETADVLRESSGILERVQQKLNKAAHELYEYGEGREPPFEGLERK